jgi:hypothetical protein
MSAALHSICGQTSRTELCMPSGSISRDKIPIRLLRITNFRARLPLVSHLPSPIATFTYHYDKPYSQKIGYAAENPIELK